MNEIIIFEIHFKLQEAKANDWAKQCYKLLATLNEDYDEILNSIERTGQIRRENLQLEERVSCQMFFKFSILSVSFLSISD